MNSTLIAFALISFITYKLLIIYYYNYYLRLTSIHLSRPKSCVMLRVVENFVDTQSLEVIRIYIVEPGMCIRLCKSPVVTHSSSASPIDKWKSDLSSTALSTLKIVKWLQGLF